MVRVNRRPLAATLSSLSFAAHSSNNLSAAYSADCNQLRDQVHDDCYLLAPSVCDSVRGLKVEVSGETKLTDHCRQPEGGSSVVYAAVTS